MPTSEPYSISLILEAVFDLKPKSILDVGCGFGKYGVMLREYLDIWFRRFNKKDWLTKIDCIEIFEKYITPVHKYIYDNIIIGDVRNFNLSHYDLIFMGDVLEHFSLTEGKKLIEGFNSDYVLINLPYSGFPQKREYMGNTNETHKYIWEEKDFKFDNWSVEWIKVSGHKLSRPMDKARTVLLKWIKK